MVTPPSSVPPPRREGWRFTIPTPGELRHPRQRRAAQAADAADAPAQAGQAEPDSSAPDDQERPAKGGGDGDVDTPAEGTGERDSAEKAAGGQAPSPARPPQAAPRGEPAADPADPRVPEPSSHLATHPTPASLPRPGHPARPTQDTPIIPTQAEPAGRRMFPNPATLVAAGRGSRKIRPSALRARRLPKVEETSAGGVVLDLTTKPVSVALIARHDRRSRLLWSLPKGHVEAGETPEQAALREVHEETGLIGRIVAPLGVIDFWFVVEDRRIHKTVHHYVIEAIGGELSDEDLEVETVEWIPYDQVVRRLAYGDERRLVEKVAQIVPGVM